MKIVLRLKIIYFPYLPILGSFSVTTTSGKNVGIRYNIPLFRYEKFTKILIFYRFLPRNVSQQGQIHFLLTQNIQ